MLNLLAVGSSLIWITVGSILGVLSILSILNGTIRMSRESRSDIDKKNTQIAGLEQTVEDLKKEAIGTQLRVVNYKEAIQDVGTYAITFDLLPDGQKIIPLFQIDVQTKNNIKILKVNILGPTISGMSESQSSQDKTKYVQSLKGLLPAPIHVVIELEKKPLSGVYIKVVPLAS